MWLEREIETLKQGYGQGLSASMIAEKLGGNRTRNAVIGKLHRMGLCKQGRVTDRTVSKRINARRNEAKKTVRFAEAKITKTSRLQAFLRSEPLPPAINTDIATKSANDLDERHDCRWPCAELKNLDTPVYCGAHRMTHSVYCEHHTRRAYRIQEPTSKSLTPAGLEVA